MNNELDENRTIRNFRIVRTEGTRLNQFLQFNGREVLQNFGTIKREVAEALAVA